MVGGTVMSSYEINARSRLGSGNKQGGSYCSLREFLLSWSNGAINAS